MKLPVVASTFIAFEQGAKAVNPKIKVLTNYVGNFEDQNAAKEASKQMIAQGADVLFHNADQAGKGMFNAAQEAKDVLVFGSNRDQNSVAPGVCVASAIIDMPHAFSEIARSVRDQKVQIRFHRAEHSQRQHRSRVEFGVEKPCSCRSDEENQRSATEN
jgi:basic membrane lipoprotein Med (substrate-binding protein (PBP1-ABC) superfamily)